MFGLGTTEIIVISIVGVVLFGAERIPEFAKSIGSSVNAFKSGLKHIEKDVPGHEEPPKTGGNHVV